MSVRASEDWEGTRSTRKAVNPATANHDYPRTFVVQLSCGEIIRDKYLMIDFFHRFPRHPASSFYNPRSIIVDACDHLLPVVLYLWSPVPLPSLISLWWKSVPEDARCFCSARS